MNVCEAVQKRVKELLKERGMTQYRLEQKSGILHGSMACIMNGRNKTVTLSTVYMLARGFDMNIIEFLIDVFVGGSAPAMIYPIETADVLSDLSPYYLIKKDNLKLLVNIKNWVLEVVELPVDTDDKKFIYQKNRFRNCGKLNLFKQKER